MNRKIKLILAILAALVLGFIIGLQWTSLFIGVETVTICTISPNFQYRVTLVEYPRNLGHIDRNFELRLEQLQEYGIQQPTVIFCSPDEGLPVGSERIVWAKDSSKFLLVGRCFYVHKHERLETGESLYLLYEVHSGTIYCNASQQTKYPNFTIKDIEDTEWYGGNLK